MKLTLLLFIALLPASLLAQSPSGGASAAWQRIVALDAGPQVKFRTHAEARAGSLGHLARQEKALRDFIAAYAGDEHAFEANLRLARLLQLRANLESSEAPRAEARKILDELSVSASGPQRVEVEFARLAFMMRTLRMSDDRQRAQLLSATNNFKAEHPTDRRVPSLLAEVAVLFDGDPEMKRTLLQEAQRLSQEPALTQRIADDLKRLTFLDKPIELRFTTRAGKLVDLASYRGKVVLLLFLAEFSLPSGEAVAQVQKLSREWPPGAVQILGLSLDSKAEELATLVQRENVTWPIGFDGKGWATPAARQFGINRLPTAWLIDRSGILRSLNAMEATTDQVRKLLRTPTR